VTVPDISVVIPTYNREPELLDVIAQVLNQSHNNLELIVLDQSNRHNPEFKNELAAIKDTRFRYYQIGPPSLPAARNFGLQKAKAPIALFLDDDVKMSKDLVKWHLAAYKNDPDISAVGGRVLQQGFPIMKKVLEFDKYGVSHGVFTATESGYTNAFPGGNHSLRVADALKVGGFDTRYYRIAFREESDMGLKMTRAGMKIFYEPRAEIFHLNTASGGLRHYENLFDTIDFYRNDLFFVLRTVSARNIPAALYRKFMEYCHQPPLAQAITRSLYFGIGLLTALWRLVFGRQITVKEVSS